MATRSRLFARTLQLNNTSKPPSSKIFIIALLDTCFDDICLRQEFHYLPDCHYCRADTINNYTDLITQDDVKDALKMLIISSQFIDFVCNTLLEIVPQLSYIYLFDGVLYNKQLLLGRQFRGMFDNIYSLSAKIRCDIETIRSPHIVPEGIQCVLEDSPKFFWYRFFFNVLDHLQHSDVARSEIFPRLRSFYQENPAHLRYIDKFQCIYKAEDSIWWYTTDCFFYRKLNKALWSDDINEIFSWRAYIQDLDKSLQQLQLKDIKAFSSKLVWLYRGRVLPIENVIRLQKNVGQLIAMTTFLSTSIDPRVAQIYSAIDSSNDPFLHSVFYTIIIDSNSVKTVFANIEHLSKFQIEREYLFTLRSLFRIDRVQLVGTTWHIVLIAVDEDDQEFCTAVNPWKATIGEKSFFSNRHQQLFTRYLNIENGSFLAFQLLIDLMLRLDQTEYARKEMIEMCQIKYIDSPTDLNEIQKFEETYSHEDAIKWYTTDKFLYRLLNKSLRLEDIDTIFKLRYYIYDLHNQLAQPQIPHIKSLSINQSILTLYRGQRMEIKDLKKLRENIGQLISMNSFFSTTNDVSAAIFFSGDGSLDNPEIEASVVYQINVNMNVPHSIPFAKIDYLSVYEDEDEVLFSMASVFQIDEVEQYGNLWVVDLTLINKEDEEWNILTAHLNE